jgi:hypothetical protein
MAGALGGLSNSLVVWSLANLGITPATGFTMIPDTSPGWWLRRIFASGLWGIILLLPVQNNRPVIKGVLLSILPWLSSVLYVFPFRMKTGFFGLGFGLGTPLWTLFFAMVWGVTAMLFFEKFADNRKLIKTMDKSIR